MESYYLSHIIFYVLGIVFCMQFMFYIADFTKYRSIRKKDKIISYILVIGYISSIIMLIRDRSGADAPLKNTLLFLVSFGILGCVLQICFREFLFTDANVTLLTIGIFFVIEDPAKKYQQEAYIDDMTGCYNRNCYYKDIHFLLQKEKSEKELVSKLFYIICDINDLKKINDNLGHLVGDLTIKKTAEILTSSLTNAFAIYRIGGDEFVALYLSSNSQTVESDLQKVTDACKTANEEQNFVLNIATGYAGGSSEFSSMEELIDSADKQMYFNKKRIKSR